ncbi:ribonuclease YeeF family protein [Peribacillus sp. SCS-26]|uniref:ribonuclease YeeF family protein n=1 Tax=Paraperibacillus marinus TaxID=3115295 RepID=UPI003905B202
MKVLEVQSFHEGIERNLTLLERLEKEMKAIEKTVKSFSDLDDSFKGEAGEVIRAFYRSCHLPLLTFFRNFKDQFADTLTSMEQALSTLEPNTAGYIHEEFLEGEVEQGLTTFGQITGELTDETNAALTTVSDIVALPPLNDGEVQQGILQGKDRRDETLQLLNEFDSRQKAALQLPGESLEKIALWVEDLEGLVKDGLTDADFPAEVWAAYAATAPLKTALEGGEEAEGKTMKDRAAAAKKVNTAVTGAIASFRMFTAGQTGGLKITKVKDSKTGKTQYRMNVTKDAMSKLGVKVEPGSPAYKELMKGLPKDSSKWTVRQKEIAASRMAVLKYNTKKPGDTGWSKAGKEALKNAPALEYWNNKATNLEKVKTVGKATLTGAGKAFKDIVDVKGLKKAGPMQIGGKVLAPIGAVLNYKYNYDTAKKDGLSGSEAKIRAGFDTAIDTAVSGGIQTGLTALGTAFIPIPGVGTAVGVTLGLLVNSWLTKKSKNTGKSRMDKIKSWFH